MCTILHCLFWALVEILTGWFCSSTDWEKWIMPKDFHWSHCCRNALRLSLDWSQGKLSNLWWTQSHSFTLSPVKLLVNSWLWRPNVCLWNCMVRRWRKHSYDILQNKWKCELVWFVWEAWHHFLSVFGLSSKKGTLFSVVCILDFSFCLLFL